MRHHGVEGLVHGDAPGLACGQLALAVAGLLAASRRRRVAWVLAFHEPQAQRHQVLPTGPCDFVDQALSIT
jgi:hypothetical protein